MTSTTMLGKVKALPFVSFVYYVFINPTPPKGQSEDPTSSIEAMLNTVALVAALMLTIAFSLPLSVSFDELVEADAR